jgi:hypothetical protein
MKYHLITYGCQMNTADSEEMAQPLRNRGFTATADPSQADIIPAILEPTAVPFACSFSTAPMAMNSSARGAPNSSATTSLADPPKP